MFLAACRSGLSDRPEQTVSSSVRVLTRGFALRRVSFMGDAIICIKLSLREYFLARISDVVILLPWIICGGLLAIREGRG